MKIKTKDGEILSVIRSEIRNMSETNNEWSIPVYVCNHPLGGVRYYPMRDVIAIQDDDLNWFYKGE